MRVSRQIGDAAEMTSRLIALCIDANDPSGLARFWSGVLGWEPIAHPHEAPAIDHGPPVGAGGALDLARGGTA